MYMYIKIAYMPHASVSAHMLMMASTGYTGVPTMKLLTSYPIKFGSEENKLKIIQSTSKYYEKLAMFLLDDDNCDIVDCLKEEYHNNPEKIVTAVYKKWLVGTGRKPVTWQTLVGVLREIELNILAKDIETALNQ